MTYEHIRSISETLKMLQENGQLEMNTSIPATVQAFDGKTKTCTVIPTISDFRETAGGGSAELDWKPLGNVPIAFPGGGGWVMSWPLQKGDPVLVIFCQRDLAQWFLSNGSEPVGHARLGGHGESNMIVMPRLHPRKKCDGSEVTEHFTLEGHGIKMVFNTDGTMSFEGKKIELGAIGASQALALASKQDPLNAQMAARIDLVVGILSGGAVPAMSPVDQVGSKKAFASE